MFVEYLILEAQGVYEYNLPDSGNIDNYHARVEPFLIVSYPKSILDP